MRSRIFKIHPLAEALSRVTLLILEGSTFYFSVAGKAKDISTLSKDELDLF